MPWRTLIEHEHPNSFDDDIEDKEEIKIKMSMTILMMILMTILIMILMIIFACDCHSIWQCDRLLWLDYIYFFSPVYQPLTICYLSN